MKSLLRKFVSGKEQIQELEALRHTCESFGDKGLRLFDEAYYRKSNPDVNRHSKDVFAHFMTTGWREGRNPSRYFDIAYYLEHNPDVREAGTNPLVHYVQHGFTEKRQPSDPDHLDALMVITPHFDEAHYLTTNPDVAGSGIDALMHYVQEGWREARNPSPDFDSDYYLRSYLEVRQSGVNPFAHYIRTGRDKGYLPKAGADAAIRKMPLARSIPLNELSSEIVRADSLAGAIDAVSIENGRIAGWVADRANPDTTLIVRVECDGEIIAAFAADLFRADLKTLGNACHGFVWKVPANICDDRPHLLVLRAGGGVFQLPAPYQRSVRFPPSVEARGNVDSISDSTVRGWACDLKNPDDAVEVEILIDGELAGKVTADGERADVRAAGFGHGNYGFSWAIPEIFKDGRRHVVTCRVGSQLLDMPENTGQGALFNITSSFLFDGKKPQAFGYFRPAINGLPDSFTIKATGPTSKTLVVAIVRNAAEWHAFDRRMASLRLPDCNVYAAVTATDFIEPLTADFNSCRNVFLAQYAGVQDNAFVCLHILNSGILTDYESVYLLNFAESGDELPDLLSKPVNYERWGLVAQTVLPAEESLPMTTSLFLKAVLPRLGCKPDIPFRAPAGGALWLNVVILRQVAAMAITTGDLTHEAEDISDAWKRLLALFGYFAEQGRLAVLNAPAFSAAAIEGEILPQQRRIKAIAFLLPQFHPVPENDKWWGKGFTEWNNVIRGRPLFRSHYQPRLPRDLGFYDLRQPETQAHQARLAQDHGIFGFCYYYYWFDGKKMLHEPIEQMLASGQPDHPFCVCWANENWSRNWDGQERHVLLKQNYSLESNRELIREFITMMKDRRYIRHNGRPVLVVYRIRVIPDWLETVAMWRQECRDAGVGEIHLCAVRFGLEPLDGQPEEFGVDSYVLFPPHETVREDIRGEMKHLHDSFNGEILSYDAVWKGDLERFEEGYAWPVHRGLMMGWDNTARRLTDARIFHGATPLKFRAWLDGIVTQEDRHNPDDESLLFINAWNEWAEGTVLEPDTRYADSYLRAVRSVLGDRAVVWQRQIETAAVALATPASRAKGKIVVPTARATPLNTPMRHKGLASHKAGKPTLLLCAHISGHMLFGGERSFLDIVTTLHALDYNLIVCLPSGNNKAYIGDISQFAEAIYVFRYPQWHSRREIDQYMLLNFSDIIAAHDISLVYANTIVLLEPLIAAKRMNRLRLIHARELVSLDAPLQEHLHMTAEQIVGDVFSRSDFVIGNSKATTHLFSRHDRSFYVPNAVKIEDFAMDNVVGEKIRFGIVSSNIPKKGVADFIEVARYCASRTDKAEFVVIGPENEYIERLKRDGHLPGNLIFAGYRDTPAEAMQLINVLLSLSNFAESFGRTVTEAMAAGRPVIAYEWGAVPELITHGETGYLVPYLDREVAGRVVLDLCERPNLITEMGARGRAAVSENYSYNVMKRNMKKAMASIFSKAVLKRLGLPVPRAKPFVRGITVVIPVYNAFNEVNACLESVIRHTRVARILVIDDGSTDERIKGLLAGYEGRPGITVVYNEANIGYTRTVNKGIGLADSDDVVLLNSDAVVTPNWLAGLRAAALADDRTGTVTAMSDNAGAFSFPEPDQQNLRPGYLSQDDFAIRVVQAAGACDPVEVPTGSGFCMYIRRVLLEEIGLFDEVAFSRGYGEENDLCMRAIKAGWKNLISPWSYVYHARTASFKGEKAGLVKQGVAVVIERYPNYATQVKAAFSSTAMRALRAATRKAH